jgi:hypothetical protein
MFREASIQLVYKCILDTIKKPEELGSSSGKSRSFLQEPPLNKEKLGFRSSIRRGIGYLPPSR